MSTELLNELPASQEQLAWDGAVDSVLTVMPAGHRPGLYLVDGLVNIVVLGAAGFVTRFIGFNDNRGVPQSMSAPSGFGVSLLTGVFPIDIGAVAIPSDGSAPITVTMQPMGVAAPFTGDVFATAEFLSTIS
jgi:hypothetical protein